MKKLLLIFILIPLSCMGMEPTQKNKKIIKPYLGMRYLFSTVLSKLPTDLKKEIFYKLTAKEVDEKTNLVELDAFAREYIELEQEARTAGNNALNNVHDELFDAKGHEIRCVVDKRLRELLNEFPENHFVDKGFDAAVNEDVYATPIRKAYYSNNVEAIKLLAENGADLDAVEVLGNTVMHDCIVDNRKDIINTLLSYGANASHQNYAGETYLHDAAFMGFWEIADIFLKYGADPNIRGINGRTPLHNTIGWSNNNPNYNQITMVMRLIEAGADITIKDADHETPLDLARRISSIFVTMLEAAQEMKESGNKSLLDIICRRKPDFLDHYNKLKETAPAQELIFVEF